METTRAMVPLFGAQTVVVEDPGTRVPPMDLAAEWARAYSQWLGEFSAENTRQAYERAWRDLLRYTGKFPWAIRPDDIRDWMQDRGERPLDPMVAKGLQRKGRRQDRYGYAPATIGQYLAAVSSFFSFVSSERYLVVDGDGREHPLHHLNPARAVRRPKTKGLGQKAGYLPIEDLFGLLRAIKQDTVQGLRDYALFVGYVFTGRRNSEWRTLRWGDIEVVGERVNYVWSGKGRVDEKFELAPPVWEALVKYLKADGRWGAMGEDDCVFTALNDHAARLANVGDDWEAGSQPLSMGHVNALLKKYARRAGLDAARISVHVLRHSAAMMLDELGYDIKYISKHLAHASIDMTAHYLDHMKGRGDQSWRSVAAALKLDLMT